MKGYIYVAGRGADPALRNDLNDPIFGEVPTLGACMPNIRRAVEKGDHVFVVSGKTEGVQQYVVGGFEVDDKISALAAYERFPQHRIRRGADGHLLGNIIVNEDGSRSPLDEHDEDDDQAFERRIQNYVVGSRPVAMASTQEVQRSRDETMGKLAQVLQRPPSNRIIDLLGRWRRLDETQVRELTAWLTGIKATTA
ncbi:MAG: hypothetical protein OXI55_14765 [Gammaproteobacteria bacterium]|nr:hypothetical protein [Gammaproteobacteria bacterium]